MTDRIPLFSLRSLLMPNTDLGVHVFEDRYCNLVAKSLNNGCEFGVSLLRDNNESEGPAEPHSVGTLAYISGYARLPDGRYLLEVEGTRRFRITRVRSGGSYPTADVEWLPEPIGNFARARAAAEEVDGLVFLYRSLDGDGDLPVRFSVDPVVKSYQVASVLRIEPLEKQELLELGSAAERLEAELEILKREIEVLDLTHTNHR